MENRPKRKTIGTLGVASATRVPVTLRRSSLISQQQLDRVCWMQNPKRLKRRIVVPPHEAFLSPLPMPIKLDGMMEK